MPAFTKKQYLCLFSLAIGLQVNMGPSSEAIGTTIWQWLQPKRKVIIQEIISCLFFHDKF